MSKFFPDEFIPYVRHDWEGERNDTGYYKAGFSDDMTFDFAWLLHQKRNKHHWQWWILPEDNGGIKAFEIPYRYCMEMICDWIGAGKAQGYGDNTKEWYEKNKDNMIFHPKTRKFIEEKINEEVHT